MENDPTCPGPQHGFLTKQFWLTHHLNNQRNVNWCEFLRPMNTEDALHSPVRDLISWRGNALYEVPAAEERSSRKCKPPILIGRVLEECKESGRLRLHTHSVQHIYSCSANWKSSREILSPKTVRGHWQTLESPDREGDVFFREVECAENQHWVRCYSVGATQKLF